jgi:hypothetical protein
MLSQSIIFHVPNLRGKRISNLQHTKFNASRERHKTKHWLERSITCTMIRSILLLFSFLVYSTIGHCPEIVDGGCNLCDEGMCFSNHDQTFNIEGTESTCHELQMAAVNGTLTALGICETFQARLDETGCICDKGGHAPHPPVTPAPTLPPTPAPTKAKKKKAKKDKKKKK